MSGLHSLRGLNLIELLFIIAIGIILAIASVPSIINLYQEHYLIAAAQNLYYNLQYARSEAIKNNQTVYVAFQTGDSWCYGINPNATCSCNVANNCSLGSFSALSPKQLTLSTTGVPSGTFTFEGSHGATYNTPTITFTLYGQTTSISLEISELGNMQLCSPNLSGYPLC